VPDCKLNDAQLAKEYCWAITQVAGRSCCGRSGSGVLDFGFLLDCLEYTYTVDNYVQSVPTCPGPSGM